ncbi:UPAR/Ly6 domain-containing protein crok-like [Tachypleus tridentatus]|uniref:UPAR/Ly6 domain-containing protein crok-like n=1 Tax=Tachypleus tridentatus TaxID=6853 RepID=UPI003FD0ECE6
MKIHTFCVLVIFFMTVQEGAAIKCWECNSQYDPKCSDPFNNLTMPLIDCNQKSLPDYPNTTATLCKKVLHIVNNEYQYIRSCGWVTDKNHELDCVERSGNNYMLVCNCNTHGCNNAFFNQLNFLALGISIFCSVTRYIILW